MMPNLKPGDEILVDTRAYRKLPPQVDDIVVARRPDQPSVTIIKRVRAVQENGTLILLGDSPASSTDSRAFGSVAPENIIGKATSKFA